MEHDLKIWPSFFDSLQDNLRTCELRKDDRNIQPGDVLHLREWDPATETYSGRTCSRRVTYLVRGPFVAGDDVVVPAGYALLSLALLRADDRPNDCFYRAALGEPRFTLIGRDPMAPSLIESWAYARQNTGVEKDKAKAVEAMEIAGRMREWLGKVGRSEIVVR